MIVSTTYIILLLLFFIDVIGIDNDNETGVCSNSQLLDLYIDNQLYNGDDASRTSQCFSLRHKCIKYQDVVLTRDVIDFATDMQVDQDNSGPILSDRDVVIVFQFNSSNASIITYADSVEADIYQAVNLVISLAFNVPNSILNFESGYESITVYNQSIQSTLSTVKHNVGITKSLKQIQSQWLKNADAGDSAISMLDSGGFRIYYALESSKYGMVELPVSIVLSDIKIHTAINSVIDASMLHNIYSWYHTQSDLENLSLEEHEQLSTVHLVVGQQIIREEIITFDADIICGGIHETADGEVMDNVVISNKDRNDHSNPRLFCGIFTTIAGHANVRAIVSTWGWKCHGFVAFSTQGDVSLNAIEFLHEGEEIYSNIWQKNRAIWKYIARHYLHEYDYFFLAGDDTFVIVENMLAYLSSEEIDIQNSKQLPLYLGHTLQIPWTEVVDRNYTIPHASFNSGGSGYVLNRYALESLMAHIDAPYCEPDKIAPHEDVYLSQCLLKGSNIKPYNSTRDSLGRDRFLPMPPSYHRLYVQCEECSYQTDWWGSYHTSSNPIGYGADCCSDNLISMHYIKTDVALFNVFNYLYRCPAHNNLYK